MNVRTDSPAPPGWRPPAYGDVGVVGLNHKNCDVRHLAPFTPRPEDRGHVACELLSLGLSEVLVLSTCNRVEVFFSHDTPARAADLAEPVLRILAGHREGLALPKPLALDGFAAVEHVFEVASSLDSLVVGERQITCQLRDSVLLGEAVGTVGPRLRHLCAEAFRVARRVRRETKLCRGASVVSLGVDRLASAAREGLPVALVGAGPMTEQAALALGKRGVRQILFVNRTVEKARALAERFGGEAWSLARFLANPPAVAAILTATSAPGAIFGEAEASRLRSARPAGLPPLVFIDLAVPFDVDDALRGHAGLSILTIDDLRVEAERRAASQRKDIASARDLLSLRVRRLSEREEHRAEALAFARARTRGEATARAAATHLATKGGLPAPDHERLSRWAVEASHRLAHARHGGGSEPIGALLRDERSRFSTILRQHAPVDVERWFDSATLAIACAVGFTPSTLGAAV